MENIPMIKSQNVKFNAIRIGDNPPLVEPVIYPINTNIMTTEYFSTFDIKQNTVSPEYDILAGTAYITDYNGAVGTEFDHFLTGEAWDFERGNSIIFKLTQEEEVSEVSITYDPLNKAFELRVYYLDNGSWIEVGSDRPGQGDSATVTTSAHTGQTYKIESFGGSVQHLIDAGTLSVKLR
jgi:hypothetical protein